MPAIDDYEFIDGNEVICLMLLPQSGGSNARYDRRFGKVHIGLFIALGLSPFVDVRGVSLVAESGAVVAEVDPVAMDGDRGLSRLLVEPVLGWLVKKAGHDDLEVMRHNEPPAETSSDTTLYED